jgi:hypothetical protein
MSQDMGKTLTRADLLTLTGKKLSWLKALDKNDVNPIVSPAPVDPGERLEQLESSGWRRFTFLDALLLMVMDDLTQDGGLPMQKAKSIIMGTIGEIMHHWSNGFDADDFWIGYVWEDLGDARGGGHIWGDLKQVAEKVQKRERQNVDNGEPSRLALANVSFAIRRLNKAAADNGYRMPAASNTP